MGTIINNLSTDPILQATLSKIEDLKFDIAQIISEKQWDLSIQNYGKQIEQIAKNEIKQTNQILQKIIPIFAQLTGASFDSNLITLELTLAKKQIAFQNELEKLSPDIKIQLRKYQDEIKKLQLMLEFLYDPRSASQITSDTLITPQITSLAIMAQEQMMTAEPPQAANPQAAKKASEQTIIDEINDQIYFYKEQIAAIAHQSDALTALSEEIKSINAQIVATGGLAQKENQLRPLITQLNQAVIAVYNKAKTAKGENLYQKIYLILNDMYSNSSIQDELSRIRSSLQDATDRIKSQNWTSIIQQLGRQIMALTAEEQKKANSVYQQILQAQAKLIGARAALSGSVEDQLTQLENSRIKKQLDYQAELNKLSATIKNKIKFYQEDIKKQQFWLELMWNPRKAATIDEDSIATNQTTEIVAPL